MSEIEILKQQVQAAEQDRDIMRDLLAKKQVEYDALVAQLKRLQKSADQFRSQLHANRIHVSKIIERLENQRSGAAYVGACVGAVVGVLFAALLVVLFKG